jgi:hypothetical protein
MRRRSEEETAKLMHRFNELVEEAFKEAQDIRAERGKGYNRTTAIIDYFPHGEQDITYELFKKLVRTENAMDAENAGHPVDGRVDDSIVDSINYQAFLYAYYHMRKEGLI